jgi:acyl-CoA thioester hydrolase
MRTMPQQLTYRGAVYPWHCDHVGHMNNMWFAGKFDEASWNFLLMLGVTPTYLRDAERGMAAVELSTTFEKEVMAGDSVEVRTELIEVRERVIRFRHAMYNVETGERCASCTATGVHVDIRLRRAVPMPEAIRAAAEAHLPCAAKAA